MNRVITWGFIPVALVAGTVLGRSWSETSRHIGNPANQGGGSALAPIQQKPFLAYLRDEAPDQSTAFHVTLVNSQPPLLFIVAVGYRPNSMAPSKPFLGSGWWASDVHTLQNTPNSGGACKASCGAAAWKAEVTPKAGLKWTQVSSDSDLVLKIIPAPPAPQLGKGSM